MKNLVSNGRFFIIVSIFLAGLCLLRVFSVRADDELDDSETEEVYEMHSATSPGAFSDRRSVNDSVQGDVRLTRPDEAALRVVEDDKNRQVPGIEKIRQYEQATAQVEVPVKRGRTIASVPGDAAPKPKNISQEVTQNLKSPAATATIARQQSTYPAMEEDVQTPRRAGPGYSAASNGASGGSSWGGGNTVATSLNVAPMEPKPALSTMSQEVSLIVNESGYYPSRIFATANVPVRIFLSTPSKSTQCFMLDSWGVRKGVAPGKIEEISFTPDRPGTYRFYCPVKAIEGTLVVREASDDTGWVGRGISSTSKTNRVSSDRAPSNKGEFAARDDARFSDEEFQQAFRSPAEAKEVEPAEERAPSYNEPKNADYLRGTIED